MTPNDPDFYIVWQPTLRTIFTKEDIAQIIVAIEAHEPTEPASSPSTQPA